MGLSLANYAFTSKYHLSYDASLTQLDSNTLIVSINSTEGSLISYLAFTVIVVSSESLGIKLLRVEANNIPSNVYNYTFPSVKNNNPNINF